MERSSITLYCAGVCCTVSLGCGGSSTTNNTYLDQATTKTAATCSYTLCPSSSDICQLRVDFESLVMASASTTTFTKGNCVDDNLVISSPGQPSPPMVCGTLTGQHMYLPASSSCHTVTANIGATDTSTSRAWSIKVSQIECSNPLLPPSGCLQYNTGTSGYFSSFGWTGSEDGATASTVAHQNNQKYSVCFRREEGYCGMQYFTPITGFAVGATAPVIASQNVFGDLACFDDYLRIPGIINSPTTLSTTTAYTTVVGDKICGLGWTKYGTNGVTDAASGTFVTFVKPFTVGVHFDGSDELATAVESQVGFSILYNQKACA